MRNNQNLIQVFERMQKSTDGSILIISHQERILNIADEIVIGDSSFKVYVKRADKKFPISSMEFAKELGGIILDNNPNARVDLYKPEVEFNVDIRLNGKALNTFRFVVTD